MDDSCHALLPMGDEDVDPYPLGTAIMYNAEKQIRIGKCCTEKHWRLGLPFPKEAASKNHLILRGIKFSEN